MRTLNPRIWVRFPVGVFFFLLYELFLKRETEKFIQADREKTMGKSWEDIFKEKVQYNALQMTYRIKQAKDSDQQQNQMGSCVSLNENQPMSFVKEVQREKMVSPIGRLELKVKSMVLHHLEERTQKKRDSFMKVKVSNQFFYFSLQSFYRHPEQTPIMNYSINSCNKKRGRFLTVEIFNKNYGNSKNIGFGIADLSSSFLDSCIYSRVPKKTNINVAIDYGNQPAGSMKFQATFQPSKYHTISFKVLSSLLRSDRNKPLNQSQCFAKIQIGEETLTTEIVKGSAEGHFLQWDKKKTMNFKIPEFLKQGSISILERKGTSDIFLGKLVLDLKILIGKFGQFQETIADDANITGKIHVLYGSEKECQGFVPQSPCKKLSSISSRVTADTQNEQLPTGYLKVPQEKDDKNSFTDSVQFSENLESSKRSVHLLNPEKGLQKIRQRRRKRALSSRK